MYTNIPKYIINQNTNRHINIPDSENKLYATNRIELSFRSIWVGCPRAYFQQTSYLSVYITHNKHSYIALSTNKIIKKYLPNLHYYHYVTLKTIYHIKTFKKYSHSVFYRSAFIKELIFTWGDRLGGETLIGLCQNCDSDATRYWGWETNLQLISITPARPPSIFQPVLH